MRETELRPEKDGYYRRNIGFVVNSKGRRTQPKISLGKNKKQAKERLERISAIWRRLEAEHGDQPAWDNVSLAVAKAIGQGKAEFLVEPYGHDPYRYVRFVETVASYYVEISVRPKDEALYKQGKGLEDELHEAEDNANRSQLEVAARLKASVLASSPGNDERYIDLLDDQTLHQAFDAYSDHVGREKFDVSEDSVNDTGKTKQSMIKQIKTYIPDRRLASMAEYSAVDEIYGTLRQRPITHRYKTPMKTKSASNLIGELAQFFDWLHTSTDWMWREPPDYHRISRSPIVLEGDIDHDAEDVPVYSVRELGILLEYATPLERLLVLLGINCSFGADQIGRLRIKEVIEKNGRYYIRRVRKKKRVKGVHCLFEATYAGIKWAIEGREDEKDSHVLVNGSGQPLWRKTSGGNRCKDIPNAWYRLLDRIQADIEDFPRHGFNTLRDTSADMIRSIGGEEVASMHLTHRHQSRDRNLRRYTNPPTKKLFEAQRSLEEQLSKILESDSDPWADREHQYISQGQIKKMKEMAQEGTPVSEIAREVGVARTTVYRWVGSTKGRRKSVDATD